MTQELGGGVTFARVGAGADKAGGIEGAADGTLTTPGDPIPGETPPGDCITQEFGGLALTGAGAWGEVACIGLGVGDSKTRSTGDDEPGT